MRNIISFFLVALLLLSCGTDEANEEASGNIPTVTTILITNITETTATSGGNVTSDNGTNVTVRGVCWSTSQNPIISDNATNDGAGTGSFISNLTGLTENTTYYVRAYANNSEGTAYGDQQSFTTPLGSIGCGGITTVTDIDGNVYSVVEIGSQCWMAENLKTTRYADGSEIPNVSSDNQWANLSTGARCNYENSAANGNLYGKLYNGWAAFDPRKICPDGWHVPSIQEWDILENYLETTGANTGVNNKMKTTTDWVDFDGNPYNYGTNESGFSGLPAGNRYAISQNGPDGYFYYLGFGTFYWSSQSLGSTSAGYRSLSSWGNDVGGGTANKSEGLSCRCIKD
ncbi:fibrobacter succinogenes major paralogous domain-containing protein [Winogradskyella sp.]|uniref:fibrobacter succinogenes major paralogous domain-containing protein n=1 Tax=Winogradskyella sp. TaxID=1883156 RepID=UPI003AB4A9EE